MAHDRPAICPRNARFRVACLLVLAALVLLAPAAASAQNAEPAPGPASRLASMGEPVAFVHGTTTLSGHLILPAGPGPHPAIVALDGSGDSSYQLAWKDGYFPFWRDISAALVDRGYAVLLYDKPGVGGSTGDWKRQSFDDRGDEAMAAVRYLAGRGDMDPGHIGLMGHSQGGWIAQLAGARHPDEVGFLILLAGPSISVKQQISDDVGNGWACRGLTGPGLALRQGALRSALGVLDVVGRVAQPLYLARIIHFDPVDLLPRVVQPTLAVFAENDPLVVPAVNEARLREHLGRAAGGGRLQVATIPGADHFFRSAPWCPGEQRPGGWAPGFFEALATPAFWAWVETERTEARTSR